jgi:hypothetical protein
MHHKRTLAILFLGGLMLFVGIGLSLLMPQPVLAQCGSQASSCKTCHEVQAQHPVNNDGTKWHQSHAFGDFCSFCHAGNQQATDKAAAHVGMVPPLSDVKAACQACHSSDLSARVEVYAAILKVTPGNGGSTPAQGVPTTVATQSGAATEPATAKSTAVPTTQSVVSAPIAGLSNGEMVVNDPNVVDYVQRYNEIVLGQRPVNPGNIVLIVLIGLVVLAGGGFVTFNELRLRAAAAATRRVEGEFPAEVVDMLPDLARLKPQTRNSLKNILKNPRKTDKVLGVVDSLVSDETGEE